MNLFRNTNKKFEKTIKQQLDGLEYKPSDSLWDKIADEIPEDHFEKVFAENVNTFEPKVNPDTWNKIENRLPKHQSNNYRLLWIPLVFLFFGSAAYFGYQYKDVMTRNQQVAIPAIESISKKIDKLPLTIGTVKSNEEKNVEVGNKKTEKESIKNQQVAIPIANGSNSGTPNKLSLIIGKKIDKKQKNAKAENSKLEEELISNKQVAIERNIEEINKLAIVMANSNQKKKADAEDQKTEATVIHLSREKLVDVLPKIKSSDTSNLVQYHDSSSLSKNRELLSSNTQTKTDSVLPKTNLINQQNDEKLTRFSISIMLGMNLCYNHLSAPSNASINFTDNISLRKNIETPMLDWSGAFLLDYTINEHWRMSSGLMVSNFSQQFQYSTQTPTGTHSSVIDPSAKVSNPNDSIINGNAMSNRIKYTWTEIPLFVTYSFKQKHKIGIEITTGISYAIISGVDAAYVSYDNVGVLMLTDKNGFPGIKNNFFFHFYPSVTYKLNELVQLGISPTFKYSINSITDNANWVQQQPYFIGLSFSLRKKF
jgi:hypothetical protein